MIDPGILASVIAAPDDDYVRLVAADWLDENGDPDRGEFVKVQIALHGMRALAPSYELWRRDVPVLRAVASTKRSKNILISDDKGHTTFAPPTFTVEVGDEQLMGLESSFSNRRGMGRLANLRGQLVQVVNGDVRWRLTVASVGEPQRDMKRHVTTVTLTPAELVHHPGSYYHQWTDDLGRYFSLKERERDLLTGDNARRWCDGPWLEDEHEIDVSKELLVSVIRHTSSSRSRILSYLRCRFRFERGFVEEAWFHQSDAQLVHDLIASQPVKLANVHRMPDNAQYNLPGMLYGYPVVVEDGYNAIGGGRWDNSNMSIAESLDAVREQMMRSTGIPRPLEPIVVPPDFSDFSTRFTPRMDVGPVLIPNSAIVLSDDWNLARPIEEPESEEDDDD